jgi:hypothetical protein
VSARGDDPVVGDIVENIPGVSDPARVRSLLDAWWDHAARQAAHGAVADSALFIARRRASGLLELPPELAERVIEREFALLHRGARSAPVPVAAVASAAVAAPLAAREAGARAGRAGRADAARLEALAGAGLVVLGSVLVGLALVAGAAVDHVPLPGGRDESLVRPWRGWLAVLAGLTGAVLALVHTVRRPARAAAVRLPGAALAGLALAGVGLLGGSVLVTAVGGALFALLGTAAVLAGGRG